VNKDWRKGGEINKPLLKKLEILYEQGRIEEVGGYFRNISLTNPHVRKNTR